MLLAALVIWKSVRRTYHLGDSHHPPVGSLTGGAASDIWLDPRESELLLSRAWREWGIGRVSAESPRSPADRARGWIAFTGAWVAHPLPCAVYQRTWSAGEVPVVCTVYHSSAMSRGTASPSRNELALRTTSKLRRPRRCGRTGPRASEWSPHRPVKHEGLACPTYA